MAGMIDAGQRLDLQNSEDENSGNSGGGGVLYGGRLDGECSNQLITHGGGGNLSSGQNSQKRPRGRPPGSKNKPKPPVIITRDSATALRAQTLEVPAGSDVIEAVAHYARHKQRGVCILSGSGTVQNFTLRHMGAVRGRYDILSLSGAFLPPPAPAQTNGVTIYVAAPQGQIIGGPVVGPLTAASPVFIVAAIFANISFDRLPLVEGEEAPPPHVQAPASAAQQQQPLPIQMQGPSPSQAPNSGQNHGPHASMSMADSSAAASGHGPGIPMFNVPPNLLNNSQVPPEVYANWGHSMRPSPF